jgi:3-oxoacyl-[acyl-carrier protein] reductase
MTSHSEVAVVTGAASGIGRHWATALRTRGYGLALADVNERGLTAAFEAGDDVRLHPFDIRSIRGWQALVADTLEHFGRIDYLFNIAGGGTPGFLLDVPLDLVDSTIDVNLKGQIYGMKVVAPVMVDQGKGHIVNIASLAGISPTPGNELYSAAKAGLRSVSLSTAVRLRPYGVYVTVLCPDLVDTPTVDRHMKLNPADVALIYSGPGALPLDRIEDALWYIVRHKPLEVAVPGSRGWLVKIVNVFPRLIPRLYETLHRRGLKRLEALRLERYAGAATRPPSEGVGSRPSPEPEAEVA